MKLIDVRIKGYRCYKEEFRIQFKDMTAIIAKNDIGKSSILDALNAFFNATKLEPGDRSVGCRNSDDVEIACLFEKMPTQVLIDTDNLISPSDEYLLNSNSFLEIRKVYKGAAMKCEEVYLNSVHPTAENYKDLFSLSVSQLKARARLLGVDLTGVNETVKSSLRHSIWNSVENSDLLLHEVDLEISKTIWKSLQDTMPLFQLFKSDRPSSDQDAEAQDPIKFAIKEALKDKSFELEEIGNHVRHQVEQVTRLTIDKIREMDPSLASQLDPKFSSFNWSKVFSVSLTNEDQIPMNKRGSGVRRLFLINFFRAKAEQLAGDRAVQDVIYAIEEPETSQHPNNQLLLLEALSELSLEESNQVIFTTHNPSLAGRVDIDSLRYIDISGDGLRFVAANDEQTLRKIKESLGMFANHNIRVFVGVEGPNDIEFLGRISAIIAPEIEEIVNLKQAESLGKLVFIPMGGSTLELWTNRLECLNIPEVHILDRDNAPPLPAKYQASADRVNSRGDHCCSFITNKKELENYIHYATINEEYDLSLPSNYLEFDDVPAKVAELVHQRSESTTAWSDLSIENRKKKESKVKKRLNRSAVDRMDLSLLREIDPRDEILSWLEEISKNLI